MENSKKIERGIEEESPINKFVKNKLKQFLEDGFFSITKSIKKFSFGIFITEFDANVKEFIINHFSNTFLVSKPNELKDNFVFREPEPYEDFSFIKNFYIPYEHMDFFHKEILKEMLIFCYNIDCCTFLETKENNKLCEKALKSLNCCLKDIIPELNIGFESDKKESILSISDKKLSIDNNMSINHIETFLNKLGLTKKSKNIKKIYSDVSLNYVKEYYTEFLTQDDLLSKKYFLFHIPLSREKGMGGLEIGIPFHKEIEKDDIRKLIILLYSIFLGEIKDYFINTVNKFENYFLKYYSVKSAIAAIMSRNMSHNIGSHILSTLGYEGISAADDRILFRYLHQRMDYIAQISTEMPKWTQSTWFLNDLMKRFYMQENLLKYLGHSEGLTAYYYKKTENKDAIEIKIRKKIGKKWGESEEIIPGSNSNDKSGKLEDFQLAIPGGVVGCHAFYTILENFIRNAAKHDWRKRKADNIKNLEITIEFENSPDKDHIFFAVYYNIPLEQEREKKVVEDTLNASFKNSFIDDKGELIRENWGLGEMRVSAGYLLKKDYGDIGFGGDRVLFKEKGNSFSGIITADAIEIGGKKYLGYRFAVPKPKELLFIGKWSDLKEKGEEDANRCGIWFHDHIPPERDYNIIIFEGNIFEQKCPWKKNGEPDELLIIKFLDQFPARIFVVWDEGSNSDLRCFIENQSPILKKRIVSLTGEAFKNLTKFDQEQGNTYFEKLKIDIYKRWIDHIATQKNIENLKIHIDLEGRGIDTSDEKEKRIFDDLFEGQLERILLAAHDNTISHANIGYEKLQDKLMEITFSVHPNGLKNKDDLYDFFKVQLAERIDIEKMKKTFPNELHIEKIKKYKNHFIDHLKSLFDSLFEITRDMVYKDEEKNETVPTVLRKRESSNPDIKKISEEINQFPSDMENKLNIETADKEDDGDIIYKRHTPKYLGSIEKQYCEALSGSQSFYGILCGYLKESSLEGQQFMLQLVENALLQITIIDERIRDFCLKRFKNSVDKFKSAKISIPRGILIYTGDDKDKIGFALQSEYMEIVEKTESNGEEKVKIKNKLKEKFQGNGIYIVEDKLSSGAGENESGIKKLDEEKYLKIDILIIHQGIIDKMDFDNEKEREDFLDSIKKCIPFVIITSGRGDPMVPGTKFIPFSSIESFLMTDYPEKNLLIQSLMQIFSRRVSNV